MRTGDAIKQKVLERKGRKVLGKKCGKKNHKLKRSSFKNGKLKPKKGGVALRTNSVKR